MAVDNQNNTYYLTSIYDNNPLLDGQPVTNYGSRNILLFSTDCQGNLRWTRTIGGSGTQGGQAQKIVLDNNGGLYLSIFISNNATPGSGNLPPRFGDNDVQPMVSNNFSDPQAALRAGFLLKYNTADGQLFWRKAFQGNVSLFNSFMDIGPPVIDSQGHLHIILGFSNGTHLDGMVTVPSTYNTNDNYQYYLVKYDSTGSIVGTPALLPIQGSTVFKSGYLNFMYDELNDRYYIAGSRNNPGGGALSLSYNNSSIIQTGFILAFNSTTFAEEWRKEINNGTPTATEDFFFGLKEDAMTNEIYVSGRFFRAPNATAKFGNYTFTTPLYGQISFVMKLNSVGNVVWCNIPLALSDGSLDAFIVNARMPIALKGNELLFAKGSIEEVWGAFPMVRPTNDRTDPLLVKFNKDTGVVTGTHEVRGSYGGEDHFTAIATDVDGNIMLGGFISGQLFVDPNDGVPTISNVAAAAKTNFFYTKLATSATCTQLATEEISVKDTDMQFYPNPVEDVLNIKTKENLKTYEVISAVGQQVKRGAFTANNYTINMQGLTKGVYFVKVFTDKISVVEKVVKN